MWKLRVLPYTYYTGDSFTKFIPLLH